jgi:hypothetical protein
MSQGQELGFGVAVQMRLKALATAIGQFWEGYLQVPTAC